LGEFDLVDWFGLRLQPREGREIGGVAEEEESGDGSDEEDDCYYFKQVFG
jgi:hypothetical protein